MGRRVTSVDEQVEILLDRGMIFDGEYNVQKAKEVLLDIGYYRLGFYWFSFQIDEKHNLKKETHFADVAGLYYLDVDLKHILTRAINRIEINFRTQLVYHISNQYYDLPTWFASKRVMHDKFVDDFPKKVYDDDFKKKNKPIKKHHDKYLNDIYAPAWKTLEFLTFGSIYTTYRALKDENLKKQIAAIYGIKKVRVFENFLNTIIFIRNICAHSGILFDSNTPKEIATTPLIKFNDNNRHSLDSSIKVILYFLGKISESRKEIIEKEIISLFSEFENNPVIQRVIVEKIGYNKKIS